MICRGVGASWRGQDRWQLTESCRDAADGWFPGGSLRVSTCRDWCWHSCGACIGLLSINAGQFRKKGQQAMQMPCISFGITDTREPRRHKVCHCQGPALGSRMVCTVRSWYLDTRWRRLHGISCISSLAARSRVFLLFSLFGFLRQALNSGSPTSTYQALLTGVCHHVFDL